MKNWQSTAAMYKWFRQPAHDYYKKGDKGATVVAGLLTTEDVAYAESLGFIPHSKEIENAVANADPRVALINEAFMYEKQLGIPAIGFLANCASVEDFKAKVDTHVKQQRNR